MFVLVVLLIIEVILLKGLLKDVTAKDVEFAGLLMVAEVLLDEEGVVGEPDVWG